MRTRRTQVKRIDGFTLIELLTVVAIIGLLVGMVVPTITAVLVGKRDMQLKVRIGALDNGCNIYKMSATGNRYYPGQEPESFGALTNGTNTSGKYPNCRNAGSALLARCLFTDPNGLFPTSSYGKLERDMLGTVEVGTTNYPNTIIDFASETMAILYYPSRLGSKGVVAQYKTADNSKYTTSGNSATSKTILTQVLKSSSPVVVHQDGMFVISAAGQTRLYFDADSVNNFGSN